jgi:hypothetical protein
MPREFLRPRYGGVASPRGIELVTGIDDMAWMPMKNKEIPAAGPRRSGIAPSVNGPDDRAGLKVQQVVRVIPGVSRRAALCAPMEYAELETAFPEKPSRRAPTLIAQSSRL